MRTKHPMQKIRMKGKVLRFVANPIVEKLLEVAQANGYGLNEIAIDFAEGKFTHDDMRQVAQLIGYSVSGYSELSYVTDKAYAAAAEAVQRSDAPRAVKNYYGR